MSVHQFFHLRPFNPLKLPLQGKTEIYLRKLSIKVCCTEKEDNGGEYMAAKKKAHRCVGKNREGNRCGQLVSENSKFCYAHRKK